MKILFWKSRTAMSVLAIALCATLLTTTLSAGEAFFFAKDYPVGREPGCVTVADFNGDGYPDVAAANTLSNSVSVLLGDGRGYFTTSATLDVGPRPIGITTGDFHEDDFEDLVTGNSGLDARPSSMSVLLGYGTGLFLDAGTTRSPIGGSITSLASGDFNRDGSLDLALAMTSAGPGADVVGFAIGDGRGRFDFHSTYYGFGTAVSPSAIHVDDVNGDGWLDYVVAQRATNRISVHLGQGPLMFGAPQVFSVGNQPTSITAADFNGDKNLDLAVANSGSNNLSILLGTGTGGYGPAQNFAVGGTMPVSVVIANIDNDGQIDLATANSGSSDVSLLLGDGKGGFTLYGRVRVGNTPKSIAKADFNQDGLTDFVTANSGADTLTVLIQAGGKF